LTIHHKQRILLSVAKEKGVYGGMNNAATHIKYVPVSVRFLIQKAIIQDLTLKVLLKVLHYLFQFIGIEMANDNTPLSICAFMLP